MFLASCPPNSHTWSHILALHSKIDKTGKGKKVNYRTGTISLGVGKILSHTLPLLSVFTMIPWWWQRGVKKSEKNMMHWSKISSTGEEKDIFFVSSKRLKLCFLQEHLAFIKTYWWLANDLIVVQWRIVAHGTNGGQFYKAVVVSTLDGSVSFQSGMKIQHTGMSPTALQCYTGQQHCNSDTTCSWQDALIVWQPWILSQEKAKLLLVKLPLNNPHSPHSYRFQQNTALTE